VRGASLRVRWALLFHDAGKPAAEWRDIDGKSHFYANKVLVHDGTLADPVEIQTEDHEVESERLWLAAAARMGVDNETRDYVAALIRNHMLSVGGKRRASKVRRLRVEFGDRLLRDLIRHRACDIAGKNKTSPEPLQYLDWMEATREDAQRNGVPCKVGDLKVNGRDAIQAGLKGKAVGESLKALLIDVAAQPTELTLSREWQLEAMERWAASSS
jgi:hypothetical protein